MLIEASNGASDYGNKIGEPIVGGFMRNQGILKKMVNFMNILNQSCFQQV